MHVNQQKVLNDQLSNGSVNQEVADPISNLKSIPELNNLNDISDVNPQPSSSNKLLDSVAQDYNFIMKELLPVNNEPIVKDIPDRPHYSDYQRGKLMVENLQGDTVGSLKNVIDFLHDDVDARLAQAGQAINPYKPEDLFDNEKVAKMRADMPRSKFHLTKQTEDDLIDEAIMFSLRHNRLITPDEVLEQLVLAQIQTTKELAMPNDRSVMYKLGMLLGSTQSESNKESDKQLKRREDRINKWVSSVVSGKGSNVNELSNLIENSKFVQEQKTGKLDEDLNYSPSKSGWRVVLNALNITTGVTNLDKILFGNIAIRQGLSMAGKVKAYNAYFYLGIAIGSVVGSVAYFIPKSDTLNKIGLNSDYDDAVYYREKADALNSLNIVTKTLSPLVDLSQKGSPYLLNSHRGTRSWSNMRAQTFFKNKANFKQGRAKTREEAYEQHKTKEEAQGHANAYYTNTGQQIIHPLVKPLTRRGFYPKSRVSKFNNRIEYENVIYGKDTTGSPSDEVVNVNPSHEPADYRAPSIFDKSNTSFDLVNRYLSDKDLSEINKVVNILRNDKDYRSIAQRHFDVIDLIDDYHVENLSSLSRISNSNFQKSYMDALHDKIINKGNKVTLVDRFKDMVTTPSFRALKSLARNQAMEAYELVKTHKSSLKLEPSLYKLNQGKGKKDIKSKPVVNDQLYKDIMMSIIRSLRDINRFKDIGFQIDETDIANPLQQIEAELDPISVIKAIEDMSTEHSSILKMISEIRKEETYLSERDLKMLNRIEKDLKDPTKILPYETIKKYEKTITSLHHRYTDEHHPFYAEDKPLSDKNNDVASKMLGLDPNVPYEVTIDLEALKQAMKNSKNNNLRTLVSNIGKVLDNANDPRVRQIRHEFQSLRNTLKLPSDAEVIQKLQKIRTNRLPDFKYQEGLGTIIKLNEIKGGEE